jgi:thiamine biosynthesis lipoprotein
MKRRAFILSVAGSAAAAGWAGWQWAGTKGQGLKPGARFSRQSHALGAEVKLTVYHPDKDVAEAAMEAAFTEIDRVESILSLYRADSEICRLNREKRLTKAHPWMRQVLEEAHSLSRATDGAFDITVQPLYKLHAAKQLEGRSPTPAELGAVLAHVGWEKVRLEGAGVSLDGAGTEITLNGIAQGFAADAVATVLKHHGITQAFIDTGEVGTVGLKGKNRDWTVGIRHPRDKAGLMAIARLQGRCLATSGDYETTFDENYASHHLLDPRTGQSPGELASVSVAAPTAMEADGLSTAAFLVGLERGRAMIEDRPGADAFFVTKSGQVVRTSGFAITG